MTFGFVLFLNILDITGIEFYGYIAPSDGFELSVEAPEEEVGEPVDLLSPEEEEHASASGVARDQSIKKLLDKKKQKEIKATGKADAGKSTPTAAPATPTTKEETKEEKRTAAAIASSLKKDE